MFFIGDDGPEYECLNVRRSGLGKQFPDLPGCLDLI